MKDVQLHQSRSWQPKCISPPAAAEADSRTLRNCGAAILCGGRSRRMGFDKALLLRRSDGRLLLASLAEELASRFGEVVLVTNERAKLAQAAELAPWRLVEDLQPLTGPVGAIHTALAAMPGRPVFIMGCDMPVVDWAVIEKMRHFLDEQQAEAVIPRHGPYLEPLYAFYGPGAEPIFHEAPVAGRLAVRDNYCHLKTAYLDLDRENLAADLFTNINSISDAYREGFQLMGLKTLTIQRYDNGRFTEEDDLAVVERRLDILVNGERWLSVMATPQYLDYLALGILFSEGLIKSAAEVASVVVSEDRRQVEVTLAVPGPPPALEPLVRLSGFGAGLTAALAMEPQGGDQDAGSGAAVKPPSGPLSIDPETICDLMEEFNQSSGLFRATGAVHSVSFVDPANPSAAVIYDDVGRHNALDKIIGRLLASGIDPARGLILTTGRVSSEIALKVHRAGVRVLISRSAPTDQAAVLANELGLTLIGFARGRRFNLYSRA